MDIFLYHIPDDIFAYFAFDAKRIFKKETLPSAHDQQKQLASWYHFYSVVRNNDYISVYVCNMAQ